VLFELNLRQSSAAWECHSRYYYWSADDQSDGNATSQMLIGQSDRLTLSWFVLLAELVAWRLSGPASSLSQSARCEMNQQQSLDFLC